MATLGDTGTFLDYNGNTLGFRVLSNTTTVSVNNNTLLVDTLVNVNIPSVITALNGTGTITVGMNFTVTRIAEEGFNQSTNQPDTALLSVVTFSCYS